MKSTKILLALSAAASLFNFGVVLWSYFSPFPAPYLIPAAVCLGLLCTLFAAVKEGTTRFGIRDCTPLFLKVLVVVTSLFAFFGMFLNLGTVRTDIVRGADGVYRYRGPEPRAEASAEDVWRLEQAEARTWAGMALMFTTFPTAYFAGVLREEEQK